VLSSAPAPRSRLQTRARCRGTRAANFALSATAAVLVQADYSRAARPSRYAFSRHGRSCGLGCNLPALFSGGSLRANERCAEPAFAISIQAFRAAPDRARKSMPVPRCSRAAARQAHSRGHRMQNKAVKRARASSFES
jgi:hypothetical protein